MANKEREEIKGTNKQKMQDDIAKKGETTWNRKALNRR